MIDSPEMGKQNTLAAKRLRATFERCGAAVLVHLDGEMDFYSIEAFKPKLARVRQAGVNNFIFDLNGTRYIDSTGLGFLVSMHRELKGSGGKLVCIVPNRTFVQKTIESCRAATSLEMAYSQQEAVDCFRPVADDRSSSAEVAEGNPQ